MTIFNFSFLISTFDLTYEDVADKLYSNGCDDALVSLINNVCEIEFDREGDTLVKAITSAIRNIEDANVGNVYRTKILFEKNLDDN